MRPVLAPLAAVLVACGGGAERPDVLTELQGDPATGRELIQRHGCGACHRIPGIREARGLVGPPLDDLARRAYIAGTLANTAPHLALWIRRPDSIRPGTAMPTLGLSEAEAHHVAAYLYLGTGTGGLGPPRLFPGSALRGE